MLSTDHEATIEREAEMATFAFGFLYQLDENGSSNVGKIDTLVGNSSGNALELTTPDGTAQIGEAFTISFNDGGTEAAFGGDYTYIGHDPAITGFIAEDANGEFYLFSNDGTLPNGTTINGFTADPLPLCFLAGTMIACPGGARAVETLAIGDPVLTADGRIVVVKWLGRQTWASPFALPEGRQPVVIEAGALADNLPVRDLRLTSDHALLLSGVLVHAGALVNGRTIRRLSSADLGERFVVYHIETENHEIILAEGAAAETFIDNTTRRAFDNYAEYEALFGRESGVTEELPQPRAMSSRQVPPSIRRRIAALARTPARETALAA